MSYFTNNINNTTTGLETIYLLVHTDPHNDVDDEIAFGYLVRNILNHMSTHDVYMMVSVKTKNIDRLLKLGVEPFTGHELSSEFNYNNRIHVNNPNNNTLTIIFHDGTTFIPANYFPNYILSIAPGLDKIITESNLVNLRGFSHQGLPDSWNGFNDIDSKTIIEYMMSKNVPYEITTPFESFNTLFGRTTFDTYEIPECVWEPISHDAFKMIIGRMPPTVPVNVLPMAESLVNMRYAESLGKPGTNSRLVLKIRSLFNGTIIEVSQQLCKSINSACVRYVNDIINASIAGKSSISPIKHYDETVHSLFEMTVALAEMGMPCLDESGSRLIYSSDGNLAEQYPEAFMNFNKIGIYTPAYDLIAADKLYNLLTHDGVF
jgi:hypothetical protein